LPELQAANIKRLDDASLEPTLRSLFAETLDRACTLADDTRAQQDEHLVRQASSALYHVTSAIGLAHEAAMAGAPHRLAMARMVLKHRLLPRDPLARDDGDEDLLQAILES
jgi:hypothetical protein